MMRARPSMVSIPNPESKIQNRLRSAEPQRPALHHAGMLDRELGPRLGFQARLADRLARAFAQAVRAVLDLGQGAVDLAEELAVFFDQAERELLLVVVG